MKEQELNLSPDQARLAELHLRAALAQDGEADLALSDAEKQALTKASPADQKFLNGLGSAHRVLGAATSTFSPEATFASKVMQKLPSKPIPAPTFATVQPAAWRWRAGLAAAALLALVAGIGFWKWNLRTPDPVPPDAPIASTPDAPPVSLAKGTLLNEKGEAVTALEAGKSYKTGSEDVILRTAQNSMVRIAPQTAFEVRAAETPGAGSSLALSQGALCAQGTDGPVHVVCPEFNADVDGVSVVLRNFSIDGGDEGIVLVFKGTARVKSTPDAEPVELSEGQVYIAGLDQMPQQVNTFLASVPAEDEKIRHEHPEDWVRKRRMYAERVAGYKEDLKHLDQEIDKTDDVHVRAEHMKRRAHVQRLLRQHEQVLNGLPEDGDPAVRSKRLHRSVDSIQKGQQWFRDPTKWM